MANLTAQNKCPSCYTVGEMTYLADKGVYRCAACEQEFAKAQIEGAPQVDTMAIHVSEAIRGIDSPASALIYLETFFDSYDWNSYVNDASVYIEDLQIMVEKNKVKRPDDAKTWELEAKSLLIPLQRKMKALVTCQEKIADKYNGDVATVAEELSLYTVVAGALIAARPTLLRNFDSDIANMRRFGADEGAVAALEAECQEMKTALNDLIKSTDVEKLPAVKKRLAENEARTIAELAQKGINALDSYNSGVKAYENKHYSDAIAFFDQIKGFRDSQKYISIINTYFIFGDELVEAGGKLYKSAPHTALPLAAGGGCGAKKKQAPASEETVEPTVRSWDLYEIIDAAPEKHASISGLSKLVTTYGENIYYIKGGNEFCVYNVRSAQETVLDRSKFGYDTENENSSGFTFARDKMYLRKTLDIAAFKKGCFSTKKKEEEYKKSQQNNYAMLLIDLKRGTVDTVVEKMVGCVCVRDFVFYTVSEEIGEEKGHRKIYANIAKMHNFATGKTEILFEKNCEIVGVSHDKVIYTFWGPNSLNRELRAINYKTKEDILLEDNIYDILEIENGKVFYRVGNKKYSPLYSINLDGTGRLEIMPNYSSKTLYIKLGWIYLYYASGLVIKISEDGKKKQILAYNVDQVIKFSGNYLYYISTGSAKEFRMVRLDGKANVKIAEGIAASDISIGSQYVYYLRREWVGSRYSKSLYRMDLDGHNSKKILFDIETMKEKDALRSDSEIYVLKKEMRDYYITAGKKDWIESFLVSTYFALNKQSGEMKTVLVVGVPDKENYNNLTNKGCSLFRKKEEVVIDEIVPEIDYGQISEEGNEAFSLNRLLDNSASAASSDSSASSGCGCIESLKKSMNGSSSNGSGNKLQQIQEMRRNNPGMSLKEAKDRVEGRA